MLKLSIFSNECSLCLFANVSRLESLKFCFKTSRSELCVQSKAFNQLSIFKRIFAFTLENYQNPWSWEKLLPKSSFLLFETSNACNDPFRLHFLGKKLFSVFLRKKSCVFVPFLNLLQKIVNLLGCYEDLWSTYTNTIAIIVRIIRLLIGSLTQFHFEVKEAFDTNFNVWH